MAEESCDIVVLTVIPAERRAAKKALNINAETRGKLPNGTVYFSGEVYSRINKRHFKVILGIIGSAGNSEASAATTLMISKFSPQICFLVGIAAGIRDEIKIGEVVLSERVVAYESAAVVRKGKTVKKLPSPKIPEIPYSVEQDLQNYDPDDERLLKLFREVEGKFPSPPPSEEEEYKLHVATVVNWRGSTVASGEKLLRDPRILKTLKRNVHRKIEVGEMEAAGFAAACRVVGIPWLVVRGVSDFGDEFKSDVFHHFASLTAATVLADFIGYGLQLDYTSRYMGRSQPPKPKKYPHLELMVNEIKNFIHPASDAPKFDLRVSLCRQYEDILRGEFTAASLTPKILLKQPGINKLLLHAPGGNGKTAVMCQIAQEAINSGEIVFFFDFKIGTGDDTNSPPTVTIEYLFDFSIAGGIDDFRQCLEEKRNVLLLADGLNEVPSETSEKILKQLEVLLRDYPNIRVIVADRMNTHPNARFQRGTIDPLTEAQIKELLPDKRMFPKEDALRQLLSVPFFLDLQLNLWQGEDGKKTVKERIRPRKEMFKEYFSRFAQISDDKLLSLSKAAYDAYEQFQSRAFTENWWRNNVSGSIARKLEEAGMVLDASVSLREVASSTGERKKIFRHQLLHDFLTGYFVANNEGRWGSEFFDTATFKTNAYEPISFAAELLEKRADEFLVKVYDWSYITADRTVIDLKRSLVRSPVSKDLEIALLVKDAEKMFEVFEDTYNDSKRRLLESKTPEANILLKSKSESDIFEFVRKYEPSTERFKRWKTFFLLVSEHVDENMLLLLDDDDPWIGWAITNTLRRMDLPDSVLFGIRVLYHGRKTETEKDCILRWRIAHLLGKFPSEINIKLLIQMVSGDSYNWTRYGAVRSLMEIAVSSPEFRGFIISELQSRLPDIKSPLVLRELRRTCLVKDANADWYEAVFRLAKDASALPEAEAEAEAWNALVNEIDSRIESKTQPRQSL